MLDVIKLQKLFNKAWDEYGLSSVRLPKDAVTMYLSVDISRADLELAEVGAPRSSGRRRGNDTPPDGDPDVR